MAMCMAVLPLTSAWFMSAPAFWNEVKRATFPRAAALHSISPMDNGDAVKWPPHWMNSSICRSEISLKIEPGNDVK